MTGVVLLCKLDCGFPQQQHYCKKLAKKHYRRRERLFF